MDRIETSCAQVRDLLSAHIDGQLSPAERTHVEGHLASCGPCAAELALTRRTVAALRAVPRVLAPPELALAVRTAIADDAKRSPMGKVVRWAFPEGQSRILLMAASLFGLAILVGVGLTRHGPGATRMSAPKAPLSSEAPEPMTSAPASTPARIAPEVQSSRDEQKDKAEAGDRAGEVGQSSKPDAEQPREFPTPMTPSVPRRDLATSPQPPAAPSGNAPGSVRAGTEPRLIGSVPALERAEPSTASDDRKQEASDRDREKAAAPKEVPHAAPPPAAFPAKTVANEKRPVEAPDAPDGKDALKKRGELEEGRKESDASKPAPNDQPERNAIDSRVVGHLDTVAPPAGKLYYSVDCDTGIFNKNGEHLRKPCTTIASLVVLRGTIPTDPIMAMTFPLPPPSSTDALRQGGDEELRSVAGAPPSTPSGVSGGTAAPGYGKGLVAPSVTEDQSGRTGNKLPDLPEISFSMAVSSASCDPTVAGGAGSDDNPMGIGRGVSAPILLSGNVPPISRSLDGVTLVLDVKVRRDGHVADVKLVSAPALPAGLEAPVKHAIRQWEYTPATCNGEFVASVFRMQIGWTGP